MILRAQSPALRPSSLPKDLSTAPPLAHWDLARKPARLRASPNCCAAGPAVEERAVLSVFGRTRWETWESKERPTTAGWTKSMDWGTLTMREGGEEKGTETMWTPGGRRLIQLEKDAGRVS